ncbi:hypothetical protein QR680_009176 [Steinernema hermaphroditum]|uniref:Uncharacterized protein n=1 Tax=Steinernema hermaphroditum TaxID=289476 RepID=A0AA39M9F0_9BILA|nr:hypothetical protein QR680_009176 [Steinernema hermaphroditum]
MLTTLGTHSFQVLTLTPYTVLQAEESRMKQRRGASSTTQIVSPPRATRTTSIRSVPSFASGTSIRRVLSHQKLVNTTTRSNQHSLPHRRREVDERSPYLGRIRCPSTRIT